MNGALTELLIRWCHEKTAHGGSDITLSEIRGSEYWIIDASSKRKNWQSKKWITYHMRETPSFTYCGVGMFETFYIKEKRSDLKRYGAMFVCLQVELFR